MWAWRVGFTVVVAVLFVRDVLPRGGGTDLRCSYAAAPGRVLTVTVEGDEDDGGAIAEVRRDGQRITVRDQDGSDADCSGAQATVRNTDTIRLTIVGLSFADVDLSGGPFAPGATAEAEGAPEIEIRVSVPEGSVDVLGSDGDDTWHWGPGGANPGLNLNPRDRGDRDVDITVGGDLAGPIFASPGDGDDTIVEAPAGDTGGMVDADGGAGDDVLRAPLRATANLVGGPGDDTLAGGRESDDSISGGPGDDTVAVRDGERDTVKCGAGRDRVTADGIDRLAGCERVGPR